MSSYTSTDSYLLRMDDASTTSTSRSRSNSLFENESAVNEAVAPPAHRPMRVTTHNSVVQAMLTSNTLRNCREVEEMVHQCLNSKDNESFMCKTAKRYIGGCKK